MCPFQNFECNFLYLKKSLKNNKLTLNDNSPIKLFHNLGVITKHPKFLSPPF